METLSCARIRLLAEQREWAVAEELASRLCATASAQGLVRTLLRALALSMVVAHRAGQPERALARMVEFLRAVRGVDYTRPLVRHRDVSRVVLQRMLGTDLGRGPAIGGRVDAGGGGRHANCRRTILLEARAGGAGGGRWNTDSETRR